MATLTELQARRDAYMAAELRILQSQEYVVGDGSVARRNRRADLEQVRLAITEIDAEISRMQSAASGRRLLYIR
jgi:hypothetical protein